MTKVRQAPITVIIGGPQPRPIDRALAEGIRLLSGTRNLVRDPPFRFRLAVSSRRTWYGRPYQVDTHSNGHKGWSIASSAENGHPGGQYPTGPVARKGF
jgi:hypothetical protein